MTNDHIDAPRFVGWTDPVPCPACHGGTWCSAQAREVNSVAARVFPRAVALTRCERWATDSTPIPPRHTMASDPTLDAVLTATSTVATTVATKDTP